MSGTQPSPGGQLLGDGESSVGGPFCFSTDGSELPWKGQYPPVRTTRSACPRLSRTVFPLSALPTVLPDGRGEGTPVVSAQPATSKAAARAVVACQDRVSPPRLRRIGRERSPPGSTEPGDDRSFLLDGDHQGLEL